MTSPLKISANYYEPEESEKHEAEISVESGVFMVHCHDREPLRYLLENITITARLVSPCIIKLPDGAVIEVENGEIADELFDSLPQKLPRRWSNALGNQWKWIAGSLVFIAGFSVILFLFVLPLLSKSIAEQVPPVIRTSISDIAVEALDDGMVAPSQLREKTKKKYRRMFNKITAAIKEKKEFNFRLLFRKGRVIGANALALPDGTIIVTDELIKIISHKNEFVGIMAHEAGHVVNLHGIRMILQSSLASLIITILTRDILNTSSVVMSLPSLLLEKGYSRDFERDADRFAFNYMKKQKISPKHLARLLKKLEKQHAAGIPTLFSTHPATGERVIFLENEERK